MVHISHPNKLTGSRSVLLLFTLLPCLLGVVGVPLSHIHSDPSSALAAASSETSGASLFSPHHLMKRSFFDIQCKGVYDKSIFARLDRICEDCYSLFREPQLHSLCKKDCFTSDYFKGCLEALQLQDEMESIQTNIKQLHGADPGV